MPSVPTLSLEGNVALITGGSRGIGAATVRLFVGAGARVVFNYVRAQSEAQRLVEECGVENCHAVQADLTGTASAAALVHAAVGRFGSLDTLVVNHGIWLSEEVGVDQMTDEQWRTTLAVNLDSTFALVKHAVAQMRSQVSSVRDFRCTRRTTGSGKSHFRYCRIQISFIGARSIAWHLACLSLA